MTQKPGWVITIDGPAASGKTTISREVAKQLRCNWVSTGAFYRGLAYAAMQRNIDLSNEQELARLCGDSFWRVQMTESATRVWVGNLDVTEELSREEVGQAASRISQYVSVRKNLLEAQRQCSTPSTTLIAEGRDCGTVVFPNAELKIFLTADSQKRAQRRAEQSGGSAERIHTNQIERDRQDQTRTTAPMQIPINAHVIDTTEMVLSEVIATVVAQVQKSMPMVLKK